MILLPLLLAAAAVQATPPRAPLIIVTPASTRASDPLAGMSAEGRALVRAEMPIEAQHQARRRARYNAAMTKLKSVLAASKISLQAVQGALAERDRVLDENRRSQSASAVKMMKRLSESDRRTVGQAILRSRDSD